MKNMILLIKKEIRNASKMTRLISPKFPVTLPIRRCLKLSFYKIPVFRVYNRLEKHWKKFAFFFESPNYLK